MNPLLLALAFIALAEVTFAACGTDFALRPSRLIASAALFFGAVVETAVRAQAVARVFFASQFGVTLGRLRMLSDDNACERHSSVRSPVPSLTPARPASAPGAFSGGAA